MEGETDGCRSGLMRYSDGNDDLRRGRKKRGGDKVERREGDERRGVEAKISARQALGHGRTVM